MEHFFMIYFSHRSLGLAIPPRIRFLQKVQKKTSAGNNIKIEDEETNQISSNLANNSEQEDSEGSSDTIPDNTNSEKKQIDKKDLSSLQFGKKIKHCLVILYYIN